MVWTMFLWAARLGILGSGVTVDGRLFSGNLSYQFDGVSNGQFFVTIGDNMVDKDIVTRF